MGKIINLLQRYTIFLTDVVLLSISVSEIDKVAFGCNSFFFASAYSTGNVFTGVADTVTIIGTENGIDVQSSNPKLVVCVYFSIMPLRKGINPSLLGAQL